MQHRKVRCFFEDDGGFSTVGMALAILLSLSLLLGATQVYRVRSAAATVQNVADACALAAEKQVASFYIVAQVCDCAVLSLSLAGTATLGLGLVAACIPATQGLSATFVEVGKTVLDIRTRFAQSAAQGLNRLQALLPVIAAVDAAMVASANSAAGVSYYGVALLTPFEGSEVALPLPEGEDDLVNDIDNARDTIAQAAQNAEEAANLANVHKEHAYLADCGSSPSYCMYERALVLAGMDGANNPYYHSADTWSFAVALERARSYYAVRYANEGPESDSVEDQARSAIRKNFYAYAMDTMGEGYVYESEDSFSAYFPLLPSNTDEMRDTALYTDIAYPVSEDEEGNWIMHAWDGCPAIINGILGYESVAYLEENGLPQCPTCSFGASSVGKVAAASSSIENGFEYHYQVVANEAEEYEMARDDLARLEEEVRSPVDSLLESLKGLFGRAAACRIQVSPPGSKGAIALVMGMGDAGAMVSNSVVEPSASLGARLAVSAATLASDDAQEAETVISSLFDGLDFSGIAGKLPSWIVGAWSGLLVAYTKGNQTLSGGIRSTLDAIPLVSATGLGSWAASRFEEIVDQAGLAPPDLVSHKPVVVNTYHVASADSGAFSQGLLSAKQAVGQAYGSIAEDPLSAVVGVAGGKLLAAYDDWDPTFTVARIELFEDGTASIPIEISLPAWARDAGSNAIQQALDALMATTSSGVGLRRWS